MQKYITFRGQQHSQVLDEHINQQLQRIEKFLSDEPTPIFINIVVDVHEVHKHYKVTANVKTPHYECYCEHEGPDAYAEINEVMDRLYKQLRKEKQMVVDGHKHGCDKECRAEFFESNEPVEEEEVVIVEVEEE